MFLWWFLVSTGTELFSPKKEVIEKNRDKGRVQAFFVYICKRIQTNTYEKQLSK